MSDRGSRMRAHTADVIIEAWGPDLASCVEEAVVAVVRLCVEPSTDTDHAIEDTTPVALAGGSDEVTLVSALDEAVFVIDTQESVPVGASVRERDGTLELTFQLSEPDLVERTGSAPKAIARSEMSIVRSADGVRCSFLVDV